MNKKNIIIIGSLLLSLGLSACQKKANNDLYPAAKKFNPRAAKVNVELAMGYLKMGKTVRAKHKILIALQQDAKSPMVNDAMAYYLEMTGSTDEAIRYYKKSIKLAPDRGEPLNNYGTFLCRHKKYQQADKYFMQAVMDPEYIKSAEAYENAGLCILNMADVAKAKAYFLRALQQDPNRTTSLYELADIYYQQGHYQQAKQYLTSYFAKQQPNAETAWLGYKLAKQLGDGDKAASYALLIRSQFAESKQSKKLQRMEKS